MPSNFDWNDYIELSESLYCATLCRFQDCNAPTKLLRNYKESSSRTIISRNYYASFKTIQDYCEINYKGKIPTEDKNGYKLGSHEKIINFIGQYNTRLADDLALLKTLRKQADYKSNAIINEKSVKFAINKADAILKKFKNMKANKTI